MIRGILSLALVLLAAAGDSPTCELDSADAVQSGINAALGIWASTKRCEGTMLQLAPVKCTQDIANSIAEVTSMSSAIAGMVGSCGGLEDEVSSCHIAATNVISATATLAAASAKIADDCAHIVPESLDEDILEPETKLGQCTADAGESMNSVFEAHNSLTTLHNSCSQSRRRRRRKAAGACKVNILDVVTVLSKFGAVIADAYSDCSEYHAAANHQAHPNTDSADCAAGVLHGVTALTTLSKLGMTMKKECSAAASRLYLASNSEVSAATSSPSVLALAAVLPITAVLSFVAGSRFAKSRKYTEARSTEPSFLENGPE